MFIVGCQFDERFSYENVEALARQSLAFLRLSLKLFGSRSARFHGASLQFVPSRLCLVPIRRSLFMRRTPMAAKRNMAGKDKTGAD
jgi:hypothetical protein